jgi:hypothetical protein
MSPPVGVEVFSAEEALAFLADRTGLADPAGASFASTTVAAPAPISTQGCSVGARARANHGSRGALPGANDRSYRATPGHVQPLPPRPNGTSGHTWHRPATLRKCLLSSRP